MQADSPVNGLICRLAPSLERKMTNQNRHSEINKLLPEEAYRLLGSSPLGLSQAEADARLQEYGPNLIRETGKTPILARFLMNFTHLMALLLWAGGGLAVLIGSPVLAIAIWMVNIINGCFSFIQEYRAEKAIEALRRILPTLARVLRKGEEARIPAEELVPGDIILVSEGDRISADAYLLESSDLRIDQSNLTGESRPVSKSPMIKEGIPPIESPNLLFAGTNVVSGSGKALVFATGMQMEFGRIAGLTQSIGEGLSPLQKELVTLTRTITVIAVGAGMLFFLLANRLVGVSLGESFIFALGMIVAFVPEGILPTVTLSLAMAVQRMAKRQALVKRLSSIETLGATTVICTDKTGTLTENQMTVLNLWIPNQGFNVSGAGYAPQGSIQNPSDTDLSSLLRVACLCNNSRLIAPTAETPQWKASGDPTEAALLVLAIKGQIVPKQEQLHHPRILELPFDPHRKRMSTVNLANGQYVANVKGAPLELLALCTAYLKDGSEYPLDDNIRQLIKEANDTYASSGLRLLALARRNLPECPKPMAETIERDLTFLGLVAMFDPPRIGVNEAVAKCQQAGIRIIMITGDYSLTAAGIARRIGIIQTAAPCFLTGSDLEKMDDPSLKASLQREVIFSRMSPEYKLRIVQALQEMGNIVAVTGDGVNDAPALKQADIGVAMGISGTDVAKEAADMVLTDDHFASIVNAVEEGRAVYENIRRFAIYIFNSNIPEAVPFIFLLFSRGMIPLPLTIMQILSIDLGTDMMPAIGLGSERPQTGVMNRPPREHNQHILDARVLSLAVFWYGIIESIISMSAYFYLNWEFGWPSHILAPVGTAHYRMATTMTLAGIVASQIAVVFCCRTNRLSLFTVGFFSNRLVLLGIGIEVLLLLSLVYLPPLQAVFGTAPLGWKEWGFLAIWPPVIILMDELRKALLRKNESIVK